jgi:4-hydroxybutyrate dehydrogenase
MNFVLDLPRIHFGSGCCARLAATLEALGVRRPLIVSDLGVRASGTLAKALASLEGCEHVFDGVQEPPCFDTVEAAAAAYRAGRCDGVVAVGGGSVIDTAKMVAVLATHDGGVEVYAGHGERVAAPVAPLVVLPTTAGSGSEVSPSAGIHPAPGQAGLRTRTPALVPRAALCDPLLTATLPPHLTANTGLDALTHCIEGFLSPVSNPLVDAIALESIPRLIRHLPRAVANGDDEDARAEVTLGALAGGIAIGKGLGPAHAMANVFSFWPVPHGVLAALSLPPSLDLLQRHVPAQLATLAHAMSLPAGMSPGDGLRALLRRLHACAGVPLTLREAGCPAPEPQALQAMAQACASSPVNESSPYVPDAGDYARLIEATIG